MQILSDPHTEGLRAKRRKSVWLAVATSLLSKGGNLLLMAIAFPLAHQVLGDNRFGLFGILQSLLFLVGMTDLGLGTGMTRRLTSAISFGERDEQRRLFSTGFCVMALAALVCLAVASLCFLTIPFPQLFGHVVSGHEPEFRMAAWISLALFIALFLLGPFARWQDAAQRTYTYNRWGAAGNFAALGILFFGVEHIPQLWYLVFSLYVPQVVALAINAVKLWRTEPMARPQWAAVDAGLAKQLLKEGLALFIILTVAPTLLREGMRWIFAHETDQITLTRFAILVQLGFYGWGFFIMLSQPMTPALTDAVARCDLAWVRNIYKKALWLLLAGVVVCPLGFGLLGPGLVRAWMGPEVTLDAQTMAAYGLLFAATLWSGTHGMFYAASGCLRPGAWLMGLECVCALGIAWIGINRYGIFGGVLGAGAFCLLITGWMHVVLLQRRFQHLGTQSSA